MFCYRRWKGPDCAKSSVTKNQGIEPGPGVNQSTVVVMKKKKKMMMVMIMVEGILLI